MNKPDVVIIMTDEERAPTPYEGEEVKAWRDTALTGRLALTLATRKAVDTRLLRTMKT